MIRNWHENRSEFERLFGRTPEALVQAPGRVNLIGDHTDYHEGFVMPMAINRAIRLQGRHRPDRLVRIHSRTLHGDLTIDLESQERHSERWAHYFQGVISVFASRYQSPNGCDVLIEGDLPPGGGLSSSSALVVGFAALLAQLNDTPLTSLELALLGRDAEHWYGTTGGIMDQFVISHGREDHAVVLDCRNLSHEYMPLPEDIVIVIANTNTQHNQIASPFALRRQQAEQGLQVLQSLLPNITTLRDVDLDTLEQHRSKLFAVDPTGVLWRRCEHVVAENARVRAAAAVLAQGDLQVVGELMAESHASLRDNYEVSSPELDVMVAAANASPGCLGARMTGGGFGGCTVNLVAADAVEAFCQNVAKQYQCETGIEPVIFPTRPSDGVRAVPLQNV
jgi:galactokinase